MFIRLLYALGLLWIVAAIVAGSAFAQPFGLGWLYWLMVAIVSVIVFWPRQAGPDDPRRRPDDR